MILDAIFGGMLIMYGLVGIYVGVMLPVRRRTLAILLCVTMWPIMLWDIDWKPPTERKG